MAKMLQSSVYTFEMVPAFKELFGEKLPASMCILGGGRVWNFVYCPKVVQQIYMRKELTKPWESRAKWHPLVKNAIFIQATEDEDYHSKRKALSAAFFKSKLQRMTVIIKEVIFRHMRETKDLDIVDLVTFTTDLQSRIIMNITLGRGVSQLTVDWEQEDGTII